MRCENTSVHVKFREERAGELMRTFCKRLDGQKGRVAAVVRVVVWVKGWTQCSKTSFPTLTILQFQDILPFLMRDVGHQVVFMGPRFRMSRSLWLSEVLLRDTPKGADSPGIQSRKLPASRRCWR